MVHGPFLKRVALVLALTIPAGAALATAAEPFHDLDEAKTAAAGRGVPILVDFYAVWCGPCKAFTKASEEEAALKAALENVVLVKIDAEKDKGVDLAKEQEVVGYPTFVLMSADGTTIDRWIGFEGGDAFASDLTASLADPVPAAERESRFAASPTEKDAAALARMRDTRGQYGEAVDLYRKAAALSGAEGAYVPEIFWTLSSAERRDKATAEDLAAAGRDFLKYATSPSDLASAAFVMSSAARRAEKPDLAVPFLEAAVKVLDEAGDDPGVAPLKDDIRIDHALIVEKDKDKALEYKRASMGEGWMENPSALNDFAWWCFENRMNLDEALELARKGAALAEPGPDRAMILDTAAEICLARGGCEDAVDLARQAVKENPNRKYYKDQLARFEKELAARTEPGD